MKSELAKQRIPGIAVAVVKGGKVVKAEAYGLADLESRVPAKVDTVFRIQSVTKQFTATGVMMLVEERTIGLDDNLNRYLDGCPTAWDKITVRHLLTQTSGLKDFINETTRDLKLEATDEQLMESVASQPLKFEPGSAWDYSNTNYHLLAMIIRKASGQWYGDFLSERIFKPLGMSDTAVVPYGEMVPRRAVGYTMTKNQLKRSASLGPSVATYGGGGIQSTVLDLAKWDAALDTEKLLRRASLQQMWAPVTLTNGTTHGYGFGWEVGQVAGHRRLSHGGLWTGFAAQIDRFLDDQLTIIVLTNLAEASPARITRAVAGIYLPDVAAPVYKPIPDNEPDVTSRFFDVLRRAAEGGLRSEEFTPLAWSYVAPLTDQIRRDMASFGPIEKLTLVQRTELDGNSSYRYQARFKRTTLIYHFALTKDGKIAAMMPEINP